jgi:hypothetical protein
MTMPKIAATLSFIGALSLVYNERAQSAPLSSLSATAKPGAQQTNTLQVRWRHGWHGGASGAPPQFYGGSYLGHIYGGFPGPYAQGYVFPTYGYGYRPFGWWFRGY